MIKSNKILQKFGIKLPKQMKQGSKSKTKSKRMRQYYPKIIEYKGQDIHINWYERNNNNRTYNAYITNPTLSDELYTQSVSEKKVVDDIKEKIDSYYNL